MADHADRVRTHGELSATIRALDDDGILALFDREDVRVGWGASVTIEVDGRPVFVKALPVTDVERENPGSTANHFHLPVHYQYGVGSAGFGAQREVEAHRITTQWVLAGECEHFPLLYHARPMPLACQTRMRDPEIIDRLVAYWDDDPAIGRLARALSESSHAHVLFVEHFPHVLMEWLPIHQDHVGSVIAQGLDIAAFLRSRGVVHFDLNDSNIVTDGSTIYAADFGLWLDPAFDLSADERDFLGRHRHLDAAEFLASLEWQVPGYEVELSDDYRAQLEPYREVIDEISAVFERLRRGPKDRGDYDDDRIAAALHRQRARRRGDA